MNISVIIVAKDNPPHIFETLDSIKDIADEIIIADIGIDKHLGERLTDYPLVRLMTIGESIPYVELIREKLKNEAKNEHVFFLDPDEVVSDGLKDFIKVNISFNDYFSIPRKNIIFDKWIEHSRWWPDNQVRLFKKLAVSWPTQIHQQPMVNGRGVTVPPLEANAIVHYNYHSLDEYLQKAVRYAKAEASEAHDLTLSETIRRALSEFISRYFAAQGYKDGMHGFVLAFLQMFYTFLVYFYYWEKLKYPTVSTTQTVNDVQKYFSQGLYETSFWASKTNAGGLRDKILTRTRQTLLKLMQL